MAAKIGKLEVRNLKYEVGKRLDVRNSKYQIRVQNNEKEGEKWED